MPTRPQRWDAARRENVGYFSRDTDIGYPDMTEVVDVNVETTVASEELSSIVSELEESNAELSRIRRGTELILGDDLVEEEGEE